MIRNKLYDELEKEGYSFIKLRVGGQIIPKVFSLTDLDDWVLVNFTTVVNGQPQVESGPKATQKTISILQRVLAEVQKSDYSDYYSKSIFENETI